MKHTGPISRYNPIFVLRDREIINKLQLPPEYKCLSITAILTGWYKMLKTYFLDYFSEICQHKLVCVKPDLNNHFTQG